MDPSIIDKADPSRWGADSGGNRLAPILDGVVEFVVLSLRQLRWESPGCAAESGTANPATPSNWLASAILYVFGGRSNEYDYVEFNKYIPTITI